MGQSKNSRASKNTPHLPTLAAYCEILKSDSASPSNLPTKHECKNSNLHLLPWNLRQQKHLFGINKSHPGHPIAVTGSQPHPSMLSSCQPLE